MKKAQVVGLCETGLGVAEQADMREYARWEAKVNADVYHASFGV